MATVPVFRQTETLTGMQITSATDMLTILSLITPTYQGSVSSTIVAGAAVYTFTFMNVVTTSPDVNNTQVAHVGDWVVYSSVTGLAIAYTATQFNLIFHT
jgi:hypothetical protein